MYAKVLSQTPIASLISKSLYESLSFDSVAMFLLNKINHFIWLHFKCYTTAQSPLYEPLIPSSFSFASKTMFPLSSYPSSIPLLSLFKPPQNQVPPLPLMANEAILCFICSWSHRLTPVYPGWCFCSSELWQVQLINIILPMCMQSPSAPSVLPLTLSLESLLSVQWLAMGICFCLRFWQSLSKGSYAYQAPVCKHILVSAIVPQMEWITHWGQSMHGLSFSLCSIFVPEFPCMSLWYVLHLSLFSDPSCLPSTGLPNLCLTFGSGALHLLPFVAGWSLSGLFDYDSDGLQSDPSTLYSQDKLYIKGLGAELISQSLHSRPCLVTEDGQIRPCVPITRNLF